MRSAFEELMQRAKEEGRAKERIAILLRQLELRFGPLPEPLIARVRAGTKEQFETWAERVVTVDRLEDVFAE
jgi:hypothetical protein